MWRGIKACQKQLLYKSYYVISVGCRWGELCSFSPTSKGSVSWANILSHFHRASLTLAAPHRHTWQWQMRQCVEEWGGGGEEGWGSEWWESQRGMGATPQEKLWLTGLGLLPVSAGHPWPRGSPWVHIFTPGQIARQARKSSPPIPASLPAHLLLFPPNPRTLYLMHHQLPSDLQPFFSFIFDFSLPLAPFLLPSVVCGHIFCVP